MKGEPRRCAATVGSLVFAGLLSACVSSQTHKGATVSAGGPAADKAFVRRVDYSEAPEMKELAERARQIGNEMYPKVLAVLADDTSTLPQQFHIIFKKHTSGGAPGTTLGTTIRLNAGWLTDNPGYLEAIVSHEMAHVAQHYKWYDSSKIPWYWREGIADYVRYKLGYTNGWGCPQCSAEFPHYTSGWSCAGAFLLYLEKTYDSNVVRQLNTELRRGAYSEQFFPRATARGLDELWAEFQKTPAFSPLAVEMNNLHEALGYVNGRAPADVPARFESYLKHQHAESDLNNLHRALGYVNGKPPKNVLNEYIAYLYFSRPEGALTEDALGLLGNLNEEGKLPGGFDRGKSSMAFESSEQAFSNAYPACRTFFVSQKGDPSLYYYVVVRASKDSAWKLQRAWRAGSDGRVIEDYPVP